MYLYWWNTLYWTATLNLSTSDGYIMCNQYLCSVKKCLFQRNERWIQNACNSREWSMEHFWEINKNKSIQSVYLNGSQQVQTWIFIMIHHDLGIQNVCDNNLFIFYQTNVIFFKKWNTLSFPFLSFPFVHQVFLFKIKMSLKLRMKFLFYDRSTLLSMKACLIHQIKTIQKKCFLSIALVSMKAHFCRRIHTIKIVIAILFFYLTIRLSFSCNWELISRNSDFSSQNCVI